MRLPSAIRQGGRAAARTLDARLTSSRVAGAAPARWLLRRRDRRRGGRGADLRAGGPGGWHRRLLSAGVRHIPRAERGGAPAGGRRRPIRIRKRGVLWLRGAGRTRVASLPLPGPNRAANAVAKR